MAEEGDCTSVDVEFLESEHDQLSAGAIEMFREERGELSTTTTTTTTTTFGGIGRFEGVGG
jgi:hypothetical protein